jgi:hypothetical protein
MSFLTIPSGTLAYPPKAPTCEIPLCTKKAPERNDGVRHILDRVDENTTVEKFETLRSKYPAYQLSSGGARSREHILGLVADEGNMPLIHHIVSQGGKGLLELGNDNSETPLYIAVKRSHLAAAKALVEVGAHINTSPCQTVISFDEPAPVVRDWSKSSFIHINIEDVSHTRYINNPTPLGVALNHPTPNLDLIVFIIKEGGVVYHFGSPDNSLTQKEKTLITAAHARIETEENARLKEITNSTYAYGLLFDLCRIVEQYLGSLIKSPPPASTAAPVVIEAVE